MSCPVSEAVKRCCQAPHLQAYLRQMHTLLHSDPSYFQFHKGSLEYSLRSILDIDVHELRVYCDVCRTNPLKRCNVLGCFLTELELRFILEPEI